MGPDIASRIKARLVPKRRHSGSLSLAATTTTSVLSGNLSPANNQEDAGDEASPSPTPTNSTINTPDSNTKPDSKRSRHSWLSNKSSTSSSGVGRKTKKKKNLSSSDNEYKPRKSTDDGSVTTAPAEENQQPRCRKQQLDAPAAGGKKSTADQSTNSKSYPGPLDGHPASQDATSQSRQPGDNINRFPLPSSSSASSTSTSTPVTGTFAAALPLQRIVEDSKPQITITRTSTGENADSSPQAPLERRAANPPRSDDHYPRPLSQSLAQTPASTSTPATASFLTHQSDTPPSALAGAPKSSSPSPRQSPLSSRQSAFVKSLLHSAHVAESGDSGSGGGIPPIDTRMVLRKLWVKRPQASATIISINEDDLVDDVKDMIIRKYANSLGRTFDSPDLVIRICPREQGQKERVLGPEESMARTLDAYFPGGQTVDEALLIDIPRRTPKASPRAPPHPATAAVFYHTTDDGRPSEAGEGYFPPIQIGGVPSPRLPASIPQTNGAVTHSIAVLGTGQVPLIPSPGGARTRQYRERPERPRLGRTHTSSPNLINNGPTASIAEYTTAANHSQNHGVTPYPAARRPHSRTHSHSSDQVINSMHNSTSIPMPTSPAPPEVSHPARVATPPPPRLSSPRPTNNRPKKSRRNLNSEHPPSEPTILNGTVPPINVLIVEDNPINLKLLEAFVKRLKVRWSTAMNGRDALTKWRKGGFHLVLMDIQLPVMNGLDATREIRRLERVNSIGVFSSSPDDLPREETREPNEVDKLENLSMFKSPVIIVALTASSLQSDRHEALAAGCNDFLTKPVNFVWLERKVMEWGCMQALIDFDGWRQWKELSQAQAAREAQSAEAKKASKARGRKGRSSLVNSTIQA